jgi:hypothetical protein
MAMLPGRGGKPQPVRFGFEGCPDIVGQTGRSLLSVDPEHWKPPGLFIAIEVKRPGKGPTPAQAAFLALVEFSGGIAFCAHGVDDVITHLGRF